jgi:hypothetical protein
MKTKLTTGAWLVVAGIFVGGIIDFVGIVRQQLSLWLLGMFCLLCVSLYGKFAPE